LAHPAIYTDFIFGIIVKSTVWDGVIACLRISQFHNHFLSFVAKYCQQLLKRLAFPVPAAFLTTAMYHFATNEPPSYVLGGDSALYIATLAFQWKRIRPFFHHRG
jgi:hypothetical protein